MKLELREMENLRDLNIPLIYGLCYFSFHSVTQILYLQLAEHIP